MLIKILLPLSVNNTIKKYIYVNKFNTLKLLSTKLPQWYPSQEQQSWHSPIPETYQ